MNRTVRAAGLAAAAFALIATATFAAPADALESGAPAETHFSAHGEAGLAETDLALNAVEAETAETKEKPNLFAALWGHAVAAIRGERAEDERALVEMSRERGLDELVAAYAAADTQGREQECLASAVYFEARGEPIEGQLAVAEVVLNRAASGKYPTDLCEVITQPWQFSFIRHGRFPQADRGSEAWRKAVAIAQIARDKLADRLSDDVLWYHADYVAPSWGQRLTRQAKIGLHIFYS